MGKVLSRFFLFMLLAVAASPSFGLERFPPPDFETNVQLPKIPEPAPRSNALEYVDVIVLIGTMSLAAWFGLKLRSRKAIFGLVVFSLLYFGFWRKGCICSIGAIQNVSLSLFSSYVIPITVMAFFLLPLVFTLFFGRVFCSSVCPLGAIQDVVLVKPVKIPLWLEHTLGMFPYIYLGLAVVLAAAGGMFVICRFDPFVGFFRLSGRATMLIAGGLLLLLGMFVGRAYCRFICPYSAILRVLSMFSKWHVKISPEKCVHCTLCENACPFNAILEPTKDLGPRRIEGKQMLAILIVLVPVLLGAGAWLGGYAGPGLAMTNSQVVLAEQIWQEDQQNVQNTTNETTAFRSSGGSSRELFETALAIKSQYVTWGRILGLWIGLVIGLKLISLAVRRKREDYEPDRARCVSCGRCFKNCPQERARLKPSVEKSS